MDNHKHIYVCNFAMIRQLGFPSLFVLLSSAETKWLKLLQALGKVLHKTE